MNSKYYIEKSGREIAEKARMDAKEVHWKHVCEKKLKKYESQVIIVMVLIDVMMIVVRRVSLTILVMLIIIYTTTTLS